MRAEKPYASPLKSIYDLEKRTQILSDKIFRARICLCVWKDAKYNEIQMLIGATKLNAKQIMHRITTQVILDTPLSAWCRGSPCVTLLGAVWLCSGCDVSCQTLQWVMCVLVWWCEISRVHVQVGDTQPLKPHQYSFTPSGFRLSAVMKPVFIHTHMQGGVCVYIYVYICMHF